MNLAGVAVVNGNGCAGIIDKHLFARLVMLAKRELLDMGPLPVKLTKTAVPVAAVALLVFLPQQRQRQVLMGLQLSVDRGEIRQWVNATAGRLGALAEEQFVEFLVAEIIWQRPRELGGLGQFQVFMNGALDDRAATGDLVLRQTECRQPQDLADLTHGQSLFWQI